MAPDRSAVRSGLDGLVLAAVSAVPWGNVMAGLLGGPPDPGWASPVFAVVSLAGFCLGVFAVWSAIKSWLREDTLSTQARWGIVLGVAAMLSVTLLGPCGPGTCVAAAVRLPGATRRVGQRASSA